VLSEMRHGATPRWADRRQAATAMQPQKLLRCNMTTKIHTYSYQHARRVRQRSCVWMCSSVVLLSLSICSLYSRNSPLSKRVLKLRRKRMLLTNPPIPRAEESSYGASI
jgi:hypothetical protein